MKMIHIQFEIVDFERFRDFLITALEKMEDRENSFVVMDNASYHSKIVRKIEN